MDAEREVRLALRVKRLDDFGRIASVVGGVALAGLYVRLQLSRGVMPFLSTVLPLVIGYGATRFAFATLEERAARALHAYQTSGGDRLPAAKVVVRPRREASAAAAAPARVPSAPLPLVAPPPQPPPPALGEGPRILK